jgi:tetratricopeptide (TPR) repeat protein
MLCLVPAVGAMLDPVAADLGRRLERGWRGPALAAVAAGLVLLLFPDRIHYVGDSLLRADAVTEGVPARALTPQALPLDVWFHSMLPGWLGALGISPALAIRLIGAVEAGVLAALSIGFARVLGLRRAALVGAAALTFWGGWLALFAGFGKAFAELVVAALALAGLGIATLRGRQSIAFGAVLAGTLLLHRSALGFLPAAAWAMWLGRGPRRWLAALVPALAFVLLAPRLWESLRTFDTTHFAAAGETIAAAAARLFAPLRLLDLANLALFLVPLLPLLFLVGGRRHPGPPLLAPAERRFLLLLALPFVVALFFLRPAQGTPRDFDDYSTGAMAVAVLLAARVGSALRVPARAGALAAAIALGAAAPVIAWLALQGDVERGLARVEAMAAGPPARTQAERAWTLDYLGGRWFRAGRYDRAAAELERAAALAPSPRIVLGWSAAAERSRDFAGAERAYRLLYERASLMEGGQRVRAVAIGGLAVSAARRHDWVEARRWAEQGVRESPGDSAAAALLGRVVEAQADTTR